MPTPPQPEEAATWRCSRCGAPLLPGGNKDAAAKQQPGTCVNCLLLAGLEPSQGDNPGVDGAALTPSADAAADLEATVAHEPPPPGSRRFQHYEVCLRGDDGNLHELGRGAMGVTYRALDTNLDSVVALKVIGARFSADAQARERFRREARAAARLHHPNVASVFHFGEENGQCFYAMELIEGETLQECVRREGPQPPAMVVEVGLQVAGALMAAEAHGLVHRDLKPGNLMLLAAGPGSDPDAPTVKIIDFGLAKATAAARDGEGDDLTHGGFVGTPAFASPEQFGDGAASPDTRSDIYSLGVTLWYLLVGKAPFAGRTVAEIRDRQTRRPLPLEQLEAARVPAPLVRLLRSMLASDPAERPQSARDLAERLRRCREEVVPGVAAAVSPPRRRRAWRVAAGALALLVVGGILAAGLAGRAPWGRPPAAQGTVTTLTSTEKSVAVLPFENRSADPENAFFADGVQDEILIDLSKIADLKVISRTSVMQYKEAKQRNLPEIGRALGVAYVVEGSVQRVGRRIRVNAQLIDARSDAHRWAERYDRDLQDVFTIQSEIAQAIAGQLQANISPREQAVIEEAPTRDEQAYQFYLRAAARWNNSQAAGGDLPGSYRPTLELLRQATARDPGFARAFTLLTEVQSFAYFNAFDQTPANAAAIREAAEQVARLRPGSVEAHVAMGNYDYYVRRDYPRAWEEFAAAVRLSPNDARAVARLGFIARRQGRWEEALIHLRRALELDPEQNLHFYTYLELLQALGRYPEAQTALERHLAAHPQQPEWHAQKAGLLLSWKADTAAARAELALLPAGYDPEGEVTLSRLGCEVYDRDFAAAQRVLAACPLAQIRLLSREVYEGNLARYRGDAPAAAAAYAAARPVLEAAVRAQPAGGYVLMDLALVDAASGQWELALEEGRRALASVPAGDTKQVPLSTRDWAAVLTLVGEREAAITTLQGICGQPYGPNYGDLRLDPEWDPLRGDPRFEAIVASLAPKP